MVNIVLQLFIILSVRNCLCEFNKSVADKDYASMPPLFHLDDYDECMLLREDGLYCKFTFELQPLQLEKQNHIWNVVSEVISDPRNYHHNRLRHGICVTTTCPNISKNLNEKFVSKGIEECYNKKYLRLGLKGNVTQVFCETTRTKYPIDVVDIVVAVFFASYMIFITIATIYEGSARYKTKEEYERITGTKCGKIMAAFSLPKNWYRLKSINKNPDARKLKCIQGIRFGTMVCVIMCHTLMLSFAGPVANTKYVENITNNVLNLIIANGQYAVQTFFLISGWLLSFHFFQMLETGKRVNLKYMIFAFINRYIRLTPTVAVMIAFECTWLVHMGKGPQWEDFVVREYKNCRQSWWTNLLYINNYVYKKEMCLHQTWYIAADTQLFALSLIILTVAGKNPSRMKAIFASGIILGLIVQGGVAFFRNYDIIIRQYPEVLYNLNCLQRDDWHDLYSSGYSNITGYIIGLTSGYIFCKSRTKVLNIRMIHHILWWLLSFGMCIFIILIAAKMYAPSYHSSRLGSALYWSFGKNIFALGIAVGIFGITQKIGWFARWVCEWQAIQILGRITFSTYIIHTALIRMRAGYMRSPLFLNDFILLTTTVGDVALSYLGGTVLCLCFEMPISALQKLMVFDMDTKVKKEVTEKDMKTMDFKKNTSGKEQILCTNV